MADAIDDTIRALAEEIGRGVADRLIERISEITSSIAPEYLTAAQAAEMTGFTERALEAMRSRRGGPRFLKVGASVRYRAADVRAWMERGAS